MAATIGPNSPDSASATNGLKASGGKLSCTSQLVSVSVRMRCGKRAAKTCATAPPVSLATTST